MQAQFVRRVQPMDRVPVDVRLEVQFFFFFSAICSNPSTTWGLRCSSIVTRWECIRERLPTPRLTHRLATKRSNSIASTPLATAPVAWAERDFRCTTIRRGRCKVGAILTCRSGCDERGLFCVVVRYAIDQKKEGIHASLVGQFVHRESLHRFR